MSTSNTPEQPIFLILNIIRMSYTDDEGRFTIEGGGYSSYWVVTLTGKEFNDAMQYDLETHKAEPLLKRGWNIPSIEFDKCMKKYGFERYDNKEYPIDPSYIGYAIFHGDPDKEMWVKMTFANFYEKEADHIIQISPYHEGDEEYNNELLETYWNVIGTGLHNAIVAFLKDEDCSGERAKEIAIEKERQILRAKENALTAQYQAKKNLSRKVKEERKKKLEALRNTYVLEQNTKNVLLPNNTNYYNSNEEFELPNASNTKLISRLENNTPVKHKFVVAVKDNAYMHAADEEERISYTVLNELVLLPAWSLSSEKFLCKGIVSTNYVKDSIIRSDITVALIEPTAEDDDSYFAGIATLVVKADAIEIDVICSQIGYKMAGKLLMNKVMQIATKLGKSKVELLSVKNPETVAFYKRFLFKKVAPNNNFAKQGTRKGLIAFRRRITRKNKGSNKNKPAGGSGAPLKNL